jgi:4-hydroxy-tetrahydrodipicolinate reductase
MSLKVCLAGVTGWVGRELAIALLHDARFILAGAVARASAGKTIRETLGLPSDLLIAESPGEVLEKCDVYVDYTSPTAVRAHVTEALRQNRHVVIGTSGLSDDELSALGAEADARGLGLFTAGNFALTATLLQECAKLVARHISRYEIVDYGPSTKVDAPSSTARETAYNLAKIQRSNLDISIADTHGVRECRGGTVNGTQIHSVRLPGYDFGFEVIFGAPHERLILKHEAGSSAAPYVSGTLLAIEKVPTFCGLRRGLQSILNFE